jgi:transcriptional regulator with XRE-family HTH domain
MLHSTKLFTMMCDVKRTSEDDAFASQFGNSLEKAYDLAKSNNITDQAFAESIGVERPQLRRYIRGEAVPSVRTVALAHRAYGISVPYAGIETGKSLGKKSKRKVIVDNLQLRLPFSLEVAEPHKYEIELKAIRPKKYEIRVRLKRA